MTTKQQRYYLTINGGPKVGWPRTFATQAEATTAAAEANKRDGITARVDTVAEDWTLSPDGEIAWLIGGTVSLRYQQNVSTPWVEDK